MSENKPKIELRVPKVGEVAPNFKLPAANGAAKLIELAQYPKPVALVFLRHLA